MSQEAVVAEVRERDHRLSMRIADFVAFCTDSIADGMADDLTDDAFLKFAMSAYLDVCAVYAEK